MTRLLKFADTHKVTLAEYFLRPVDIMKLGRMAFFVAIITSLGFDRIAVTVSGATIRLNQVVIFGIFLLLVRRIKYNTRHLLTQFIFLAMATLSILYSGEVLKSFMYLGWVGYNYFVLIGMFSYFAYRHGDELFEAIVYAYRLQIIMAVFFVVTGVQPRASLLYYEPSYFGISLLIYASIVYFKIRNEGFLNSKLDVLLLVLSLLATQSATYMLGLFFLYLVDTFFMSFSLRKVFVGVALSFLAWGAIHVYSEYLWSNNTSNYISGTYSIIRGSNWNIASSVEQRGGNRINRMACAHQVFEKNRFLGVGIGAYVSYIRNKDLTKCEGLAEIVKSSKDVPAVNIYVEILATVGLLGGIPLFFFLLDVAIESRLKIIDWRGLSYFAAMMAILLVLNFESNYLRLYLWMIIGVVIGHTRLIVNTQRRYEQEN